MLLDLLNLNQLRVFEAVFRARSMTAAARELHLTQSGISQHMKALEEGLGMVLFDRIRKRLVPTPAAVTLYGKCEAIFGSLEAAVAAIKAGARGGENLVGSLSIGMPIEFGNNLVAPLLSAFGRKNPGIRYRLKLGFASAMNDQLLRGELDFAFVDDYRMDRTIAVEKICDETLELCISPQALRAKPRQDRRFFESLDYVEYQASEPLLRNWFAHHLNHRNVHLNIRATVMDVQGIARLILSGLGAGIIPGHLLQKLQREGHKLTRFSGSGVPLRNAISIAYLKERSHSPATTALIAFLKERLQGAALK